MSNPILFLDVDGVLNSNRWFSSEEGRKREFVDDWRETHIDPDAVAQLNRIVTETRCDIILSSTWRNGYSLGSTLRCFRRKGISEESWNAIVGKTPNLNTPRGREIKAWLDENHRADSVFVILDDDGDMEDLIPYLVLTNANEGLTREIADVVIERLKSSKPA